MQTVIIQQYDNYCNKVYAECSSGVAFRLRSRGIFRVVGNEMRGGRVVE